MTDRRLEADPDLAIEPAGGHSHGTIHSLERGLRILDMLAEADADPMRRERGVTMRIVASALDVHRTTALRLMQTLVAAGYAAPTAGRRGYRLGPAMRRDAVLSMGTQRFRRAARPFLEVVERTGECAHAAVSDGDRALVVDDVETERPLRAVSTRGRHVALHTTSVGKCLMAYGLADVPATLPARTMRTITRRDVLLAHLAEIREQGYALDDEENDSHTRCISAPVFEPDGAPIGCIGIDAPSVRLAAERLVEATAAVVEVAGRLSRQLAATRSA